MMSNNKLNKAICLNDEKAIFRISEIESILNTHDYNRGPEIVINTISGSTYFILCRDEQEKDTHFCRLIDAMLMGGSIIVVETINGERHIYDR